ncbi:MAG: hypothetical protein P8X74_03650 [Reinekea sp.]
MIDYFDGDPLLILGSDGTDLIFKGGQPVMDQGFLNRVNLALLTESGHWSEDLETVDARKYKGLTLQQIKKPITRQMLIDTAKAAETDVKGDEFKDVKATVTNPTNQSINLELQYTPPSRDPQKLRLTRNGENWIQQRDNPQNDYLNGE